MVRVKFDREVPIDQIRQQLSQDLKLVDPPPQIQVIGTESKEFIIRLKKDTPIPPDQEIIDVRGEDLSVSDRVGKGVIYTREGEVEVDLANFVTAGLEALNEGNALERLGTETFSPSFGGELAVKGLLIVVVSWFFILLYISVRFQLAYGVAAVIALLHDVLITLGALGMATYFGVHREVNLSVIAGLLTVIGYSVNDTIVVFDRIRENRRGGTESLKDIINRSLNQSLSRTLVTSLTTLFAVLILFLFGGDILNDFAFVLLVGVIVGTYSSIFIGSFILYLWQGRKETVRAKA